jgi:hypothetical protein
VSCHAAADYVAPQSKHLSYSELLRQKAKNLMTFQQQQQQAMQLPVGACLVESRQQPDQPKGLLYL